MTASNGNGNSANTFLSGGGETGALLRAMDWSSNPLGEPGYWPSALKQMVSMMLSATLPVLICWGEDYIQLYNDAFRPINGLSKHPQALGAPAGVTYGEIWDTIGPLFGKVMQGEPVKLTDFKVVLHRNDYPEDCYFDFSYSPIKDEAGTAAGVLVICLETTQKVRLLAEYQALNEEMGASSEEVAASNEELAAINDELASVNEELSATNDELLETQRNLSRSEKLFRSIVLNIPNSLIVVINREHRYIAVEGDLMDKLGYDRRDYEGKHPSEISAERYAASKHLFEKVMTGERFSVERKGAAGEDYIIHFVPMKNEADEVESAMIILFDISDVKKAEERSAKLAAIIESSDDAIISKTLESVITSWNASAERMFGYKDDEIIGQSIYKLIPTDRKEEEPRILSRLSRGERVEHFETKRVTKSGKLLDVSLTISPIKDSLGNIIGLSKIARDITERKLEEQRKNDFVAMVSHELKTPLTTITSYVQLLLSKAKTEGDTFRINALIRTEVQAKKMSSMINDFLNLARLEDGKVPLDKNIFQLDKLITEIAGDAQSLTSRHEVKILECGEILVNADRNKLGQVLTNLLSNAIKYSPAGGTVTIGCEEAGGQVRVFVTDEGVGISSEDQKRLFERFYRANNNLKTVSGFGIGLYLVSEVLRYHNTEIEVTSEVGKGSTFYFVLPVAEA